MGRVCPWALGEPSGSFGVAPHCSITSWGKIQIWLGGSADAVPLGWDLLWEVL